MKEKGRKGKEKGRKGKEKEKKGKQKGKLNARKGRKATIGVEKRCIVRGGKILFSEGGGNK